MKDADWERDIYSAGRQLNRYPFDAVVSFVFTHAPASPRSETQILEVGCGAGNNLWFAAREGFAVAGIDASQTAIACACERFHAEGLAGEFHVSAFSPLPFDDGRFDLTIDRAALSYVPRTVAAGGIHEVWRVLKPGGHFLFTPYSARHTSARGGALRHDGLVESIDVGSLAGGAPVCFYDRSDLTGMLPDDAWELASIHHVEIEDGAGDVHAEWRVVARRRS